MKALKLFTAIICIFLSVSGNVFAQAIDGVATVGAIDGVAAPPGAVDGVAFSYQSPMKSAWFFLGAYTSASAVRYLPVQGTLLSATELDAALICPSDGVISLLRVVALDGVPGSGKSYAFTVRRSTNAGASFSDTAVTCTMANTSPL